MKKIFILAGIILLASCSANEQKINKTEVKNEIKTYTIDEIKNHNNEKDCYTIIDKKVYDLTSFLSKHPGGPGIKKACGIDATEIFKSQKAHSNAKLDGFYIGELK